MEPADFENDVADIFAAALGLTDRERAALLDERCAGRAELRVDVESLLQAHDRAQHFIQPVTHALEGALGGAFPVRPRLAIGDRVGAFRLVEIIGEGGMGTVYRAERADREFSQQVAIKFIGSWIHDEAAVDRFRTERQILASLRHPHIVSLIDGGVTPDDQAYLVMEYVDGQPITTYCNDRGYSLQRRLELFKDVCAAVQVAHSHLVVHRDLKPANIVVTGDGVAKVLDFGVAKLLAPSSATGVTLTTLFPGPLTPNYASPEQLRGLPVTTACDVYALGVVLYELLTGQRPYETSGKSVDEVLSLVLDTDPRPPRAVRGPAVDGLPFVPSSLSSDLDAIVLKALEKAPSRRYASAVALADDVSRYLEGRAVHAQPDRAVYRASKFIRRHRVAVAGVGAALLSLVFGLGVALWQAEVARTERDRARLETAKARQVSAFLGALFTSNAPRQALGRTLTAQDLMEIGVDRIDRELSGQPDLQASMLATLGSVYSEMGLRDKAVPLLERSIAMREKVFGPEHVEVAESLRILGRLKNRTSDYVGAEPLLRRALGIRERLIGPDDPALPPTLSELGLVLWRRGRYEEGRDYLRRAVAIEETTGSPDLQKWLSNLSLLEQQLGDMESAEKLSRRALEFGLKTAGSGIPVDVTMLNLASVLRLQEDLEGARALLEEVNAVQTKTFGAGRLYTLGELGDVYLALGDRARARAFLDRAIATAAGGPGPDHHDLAPPLTYLGRLLLAEGKASDALPVLERALAIRERTIGPKHTDTAETLVEIARAKAMLDGPDVAEPLMRRALAMQRETLVPGHRFLVPTLTALSETLLARGAAAEAHGLLQEAVGIAQRRLPPHHSHRRRAETALKRIDR